METRLLLASFASVNDISVVVVGGGVRGVSEHDLLTTCGFLSGNPFLRRLLIK